VVDECGDNMSKRSYVCSYGIAPGARRTNRSITAVASWCRRAGHHDVSSATRPFTFLYDLAAAGPVAFADFVDQRPDVKRL
jgi:hypothetical protein